MKVILSRQTRELFVKLTEKETNTKTWRQIKK